MSVGGAAKAAAVPEEVSPMLVVLDEPEPGGKPPLPGSMAAAESGYAH